MGKMTTDEVNIGLFDEVKRLKLAINTLAAKLEKDGVEYMKGHRAWCKKTAPGGHAVGRTTTRLGSEICQQHAKLLRQILDGSNDQL